MSDGDDAIGDGVKYGDVTHDDPAEDLERAAEDHEQAEASPPPSVPEGFGVHDGGSANWLVRKVVEARHYALRVEAWAERETRRARDEEASLLGRFGRQLEDWTRRQLAAERGGRHGGRRRRSLSLPAGTVGFRSTPPRLDVTDPDGLLRWCRARLPAAVATAERVLKDVVRAHVAATGELPEGAEPSEGGERFFIK